jgi:hypothetical protein
MATDIIKYFLSFSVIVAGITYLLKHFADLYFNKDIERFKSELEKITIEHQIRYAKLHEERAHVIKEVYRKIAVAEKWMKEYVTPIDLGGLPPIEERSKRAAESANEFVDYYKENKIFLNNDICKLLDEIHKCIAEAWIKFNQKDRVRPDKDYWGDSWQTITEKLPQIKEKLENDFRNILGVG